MRKLLLCLGLALLPAWTASAKPARLGPADLKRLAPHPRLILTEKRLKALKAAVKTDERLAWKISVLKKDGEAMLALSPSTRVLIGPRLLAVSREVLKRVYTLGLLYRLEGDERYFERAKTELLAAAAFSDWNPSHFLDVAELSHALAIGYDWFYDKLSAEERKILREAMVEKGLKQSLPLYKTDEWQVASEHNWNQVVNGGLGMASLCLGDEEPKLALKVLQNGLRLLPNALHSYGTDGGWVEGPSYWHYATRYTVYYIDALDTALGKDFGLTAFPGLKKAGNFYMHAVGPGRRAFNYADSKEHLDPSHAMLYLARRYKRPIYSVVNELGYEEKNVDPYSILWHQKADPALNMEKEALDAYFKNVQVAFFRSAWAVDTALFVGFKGGDNRANHGHLDLGSFVLDADGVRWAVDLGGDDYNLPGYWDKGEGGERWKYYRLNTASHNTLSIGGKNQKVEASAPITRFSSTGPRAFAVADLKEGYPSALSAQRGVAMLDRKRVLLQDELKLKAPEEVRWGMMTKAALKLEGSKATLSQDGKQLEARILAPAGAVFEEVAAKPPLKEEKQNEDCRMLAVRLQGVTETTLSVLLTPLGLNPGAESLPELKPLKGW